MDEYHLHNKRQVSVRGRIPSPKNGASIRPTDEYPLQYPLQHKGQVFVPWMNTLPKTWGKCSSLGRIPSATHGGKYSYYGRTPQPGTWGKYLPEWTNSTYSTNGFVRYSSYLFVFVRGVQRLDDHALLCRPGTTTTLSYGTTVYITPSRGGLPSSIARHPRGCQYRTTRLRKAPGETFPPPTIFGTGPIPTV